MTTKTILFSVTPDRYQQDAGRKPLSDMPPALPYDVDLDRLTPTARRVAEGISTTDPLSPLSRVWLRDRQTYRQIVAEKWDMVASQVLAQAMREPEPAGRPARRKGPQQIIFVPPQSRVVPIPSPEVSVEQALPMLQVLLQLDGRTLDDRPVRLWPWPALEPGEQPEAYLEAQVQAMLQMGEVEHLALETDNTISVGEAAQRLGVASHSLVRRWCREGRIPAVKRGPDWRIYPEDLVHMEERPPRGRPRRSPASQKELP